MCKQGALSSEDIRLMMDSAEPTIPSNNRMLRAVFATEEYLAVRDLWDKYDSTNSKVTRFLVRWALKNGGYKAFVESQLNGDNDDD